MEESIQSGRLDVPFEYTQLDIGDARLLVSFEALCPIDSYRG
jgi:hypothetical protein